MSSQSGPTDPLEASLVHSDSEKRGEETKEYVKLMDSFEPNRRKYYEPLGENTQMLIPSFEKPPKIEQKPLPSDSCHGRVIRNQQNLFPIFLLLP